MAKLPGYMKRINVDLNMNDRDDRYIYKCLQESKKQVPMSWHVKAILLKGLKEEDCREHIKLDPDI